MPVLALCGGLIGCGDPLVDGDYRGEPLLTLEGSVYVLPGSESSGDEPDAIRIAVFWAGGSVGEGEQEAETAATFPAEYTLDLLKPPPAAARIELPWAPGARVAVGTPVLYRDADGDERWSDADRLAGGTSTVGVIYVDEDVPEGVDLEPGYQRASTASPLCDAAEDGPILPPDTDATPLYATTPWGIFSDWDCDGELAEWRQLCPPPEELEFLCQETLAVGPGLLSWCLEQTC